MCDTHHYIPDTGKKDPLVVQEESVRLPVRRPECTYTQPYINTSSWSYPFVFHGFSVSLSVGLLIGALRFFCQNAVTVWQMKEEYILWSSTCAWIIAFFPGQELIEKNIYFQQQFCPPVVIYGHLYIAFPQELLFMINKLWITLDASGGVM